MTIFQSAGRDSGGRYRHAYLGLAGLGASIARRWRDHKTQRSLDALPEGIMKDFGYPSIFHAPAGTGICRKKI